MARCGATAIRICVRAWGLGLRVLAKDNVVRRLGQPSVDDRTSLGEVLGRAFLFDH
ncbi:MAG TPA: hypothetical protein VK724_09130 [Bryobacteraceae bacterium]|nr:hypothetical protein [Bryobacteraceae bacterium]